MYSKQFPRRIPAKEYSLKNMTPKTAFTEGGRVNKNLLSECQALVQCSTGRDNVQTRRLCPKRIDDPGMSRQYLFLRKIYQASERNNLFLGRRPNTILAFRSRVDDEHIYFPQHTLRSPRSEGYSVPGSASSIQSVAFMVSHPVQDHPRVGTRPEFKSSV